jgi:two-component system, OmpR family, response regulator
MSTAQLSVLVVDDDPEICTLLNSYLSSQGVMVGSVRSEAEMLSSISGRSPDVILMDINLGTEDGFSIARRLRQSWQGGLIMLTGRGDTIDRVVGLEIGADDYVAKPFDLRELLARVRSVVRRTARENTSLVDVDPTPCEGLGLIVFDHFSLALEARELRDEQDQIVALTTGEFSLLCALLENRGRVLSRDRLMQITHRREAGPFDRTIDVQIGRLRKKLGDDSNSPRIIKSVRGQGYLFAPEVKRKD